MRFITHYLVAYDVSDNKRLRELNKLLRGYLFHQQHSIFEGELTEKQFKEMKTKMDLIVNRKKDSIIIYPLSKTNIFSKIVMGKLTYPIKRII